MGAVKGTVVTRAVKTEARNQARSSGANALKFIEFESSEARRAWSAHLQTLINSQQKLQRAGIASVMKVGVDKVLISISLTSIAKTIVKAINVKEANVEVEVKGKALVIKIAK